MRLSYRQGNASGRFVFVFRRTLQLMAALFAILLASSSSAAETTVRVRIAFGAETPQSWQGKIEAEGGSLSGLQSLAMSPEAVGDVWLTPEGVTVQHDTPVGREALDVTISGEADAKLIASLTFPGESSPLTAEFTLEQLRSGESQVVYGPNGSRFIAQRLPDDRLRIELDRKNLLFDPGETLNFDVVADPAGVEPGGTYDFSVELFEGRDGESVWRGETQRIDVPLEGIAKLPVTVPLPSQEGVYRIQLRVARPAGFVDRFRAKSDSQTLSERTFQIVVFDKSAPVAAPGEWQETYMFDPASPRWRDRLPAWTGWRRLRGADVGPLSSQTGSVVHVAKEGFVEIEAAPEKNMAHWQAYPLAVQRPGEPCLVEIEYPTDTPQQLGVSMMDTDSDGILRPLGDAVVTETPRWGRAGKVAVARFVCWPRTEEPMLVLHNPDAHRLARFGKVRVYQTSTAVSQRTSPAGGRLVSLDFTNPHLAASLGTVLDGESPQDDLQQFYETARRLAERVQLAGAGGAVVAVNGQGGAIYPSRVHGNAPLYASGVWQSGTNDLPQQALLDLLLSEFDRRGLRLTTSVRFDAPLPSLEAELRQNNQAAPRWVSTSDEVHPSLRYNALDPGVQEAMLAGVGELIRYGASHPSFAGVALRIGPNGGPLLPGSEWGYDTATVDRFLESAGLRWPPGAARSPEAYAAAITENASDEWNAWRYAQLSDFHKRAKELTGGKVLLLGESLRRMAPLRTATTPRLGSPRNVKKSLASLGLAAPAGSDPAFTTPIPWTFALDQPLANFSAATESSDRLRATLLESPDRQMVAQIDTDRWDCRLYNFARWLKVTDDVVLHCTAAPPQGEVVALAEAFAYGVSETVVDGGPVTSGWQDKRAESLRRLLVDLPQGTLSGPSSVSHDSVLARVISRREGHHKDSHLVVINTSPWQREAQLSIELAERSLGTPLSGDSSPAEWYDGGRHVLKMSLPPGEAQVWRFSGVGLKIEGVRLQSAPEIHEELADQIADLRRRDRTERRPYTVLANPSFESSDASSRPLNWQATPDSAARVTGDAYEGNLCLALRSNGEKAEVMSDAFPRPTTGQLAIVFQATGRELSSDAQLRIAVEEVTEAPDSNAYHVHTTVPAASLAIGEGGTGWRELVFAMDDLPLGGDTPLRLRFTLTGAGEVRIDDLRMEDLKLPIDSYAEELRPQKLALVRMVHAAEKALDDERLADCQRLLDSYWSRFLTEHFPLEKTPPPIAKEADDATTTAADEGDDPEESPSVADRFRRYLPSIWR